jgi:hypothetical protein
MLYRLPGLLADEQARQSADQLLAQQRQLQEQEDLELQGVTLSHADAGP